MIRFLCPACRKHYRGQESQAGQEFSCRKCGQLVRVPKSASTAIQAGSPAPGPVSASSHPRADASQPLPADTSPWYRGSGFVGTMAAVGFFFFPPLLWIACLLCLSGPIFYSHRNPDGTRATWSIANKFAAVFFLIVQLGAVGFWYLQPYLNNSDAQEVAQQTRLSIAATWSSVPELKQAVIEDLVLVHRVGKEYEGFLVVRLDGQKSQVGLQVVVDQGNLLWQLRP